jgi:hypothetical protein
MLSLKAIFTTRYQAILLDIVVFAMNLALMASLTNLLSGLAAQVSMNAPGRQFCDGPFLLCSGLPDAGRIDPQTPAGSPGQSGAQPGCAWSWPIFPSSYGFCSASVQHDR